MTEHQIVERLKKRIEELQKEAYEDYKKALIAEANHSLLIKKELQEILVEKE